MKIKREWETMNDYRQINNRIIVPLEEVKIENNHILPSEEERLFNMVQIPEDESILFKYCWIKEDSVFVDVFSKNKKLLEKENNIKDKLAKNDFEIKSYDIVSIDENGWLKLDINMNFDKDTIEKIEAILESDDWEVINDSYMENIFIVYKIN